MNLRSMTNTQKEENTETVQFVRRKMSLTASHDNQMQNLADEHYGGNCSQFVRSAIEDHARTINGVNENLLRELSDDIFEIKDMVEQLNSQIHKQDNIDNNRKPSNGEYLTEQQLITRENSLSKETLKIYQLLAEDYPDQRTLSSIVANVSLSEDAVDQALLSLKTRGDVISETIDNVPHYMISPGENTMSGGKI